MAELESLARMGLVFVHLLLCVFALQAVLEADLRVLRRRFSRRAMHRLHRRVAWLLAGLWFSGLAIIVMDVGLNLALVAERPKLLAKLVCVLVLTLNGVALTLYALPRITAHRPLKAGERYVLALLGAVSTASWLMAAFIGAGRPLAAWPLPSVMGLYGAALLLACAVALVVCPQLMRPRAAGGPPSRKPDAPEAPPGGAEPRDVRAA